MYKCDIPETHEGLARANASKEATQWNISQRSFRSANGTNQAIV